MVVCLWILAPRWHVSKRRRCTTHSSASVPTWLESSPDSTSASSPGSDIVVNLWILPPRWHVLKKRRSTTHSSASAQTWLWSSLDSTYSTLRLRAPIMVVRFWILAPRWHVSKKRRSTTHFSASAQTWLWSYSRLYLRFVSGIRQSCKFVDPSS